MQIYTRWYKDRFERFFAKPFVHIMVGARQTGKSTLIKQVLPPDALVFDLSRPKQRSRFLADPQELIRICRSLPKNDHPLSIFIDEVQAVPELFNAIQSIYDNDETSFRFILCSSSTRKLRATSANLLPARSILHRLHPLINEEYEHDPGWLGQISSPIPLPNEAGTRPSPVMPFPARTLENRLTFGDLPGISCSRYLMP